MKWAKTEHHLDDDKNQNEEVKPEDREVCFEMYQSISKVAQVYHGQRKDGSSPDIFHLWVTHPTDVAKNTDNPKQGDPPERLTKRAKKKYEIFVGGFLHFYDNVLKEFLREHAAKHAKEFAGGDDSFAGKLEKYIDSINPGYPDGGIPKDPKHKIIFEWLPENNPKTVSIYINPAPYNPDPPDPGGTPPPESYGGR